MRRFGKITSKPLTHSFNPLQTRSLAVPPIKQPPYNYPIMAHLVTIVIIIQMTVRQRKKMAQSEKRQYSHLCVLPGASCSFNKSLTAERSWRMISLSQCVLMSRAYGSQMGCRREFERKSAGLPLVRNFFFLLTFSCLTEAAAPHL